MLGLLYVLYTGLTKECLVVYLHTNALSHD
jgi:hypothetical protein